MKLITDMTLGAIYTELAAKLNTLFALNGEYAELHADAVESDSDKAFNRMGEISKTRVGLSARVRELAFSTGNTDYIKEAAHAAQWGLFPLWIEPLVAIKKKIGGKMIVTEYPELSAPLCVRMAANGKGTGVIVANV